MASSEAGNRRGKGAGLEGGGGPYVLREGEGYIEGDREEILRALVALMH
jgi:hypothetical protein